jgi:lysophospholipase L1-like esterase
VNASSVPRESKESDMGWMIVGRRYVNKDQARLRSLSALLVVFGVAVVCAVAAAERADASHGGFVYLSLGDSLAAGEGGEDPAFDSYAALVHTKLQPERPGRHASRGDLINLGKRGGETTARMRYGGQLDEAVREITTRRLSDSTHDDVTLITLSLGGNDLFPVLEVCAGAPASPDGGSPCGRALAQGYADFAANFDFIIGAIKQAAGANARIVVLTYYNSLPACNLASLAPAAELALEGDGAVVPGLNNLIRQIAAFRHVLIAEGYGRLSSNNFVGGNDCRHPNSAGHAKLAAAFLEALKD